MRRFHFANSIASASKIFVQFSYNSKNLEPFLFFTSEDDLLDLEFMKSIEPSTQLVSQILDENEITTQISKFVSPKSLMDTYGLYQKQVSINHCVLILRIIARYPLLARPFYDDINFNEQMKSLVKQINSHIKALNELDLLDMMFWTRKMTTSGLYNIGPKYFDKLKMIQQVNYMVRQNKYTLRNLIGVYFDYVFLDLETNQISFKILELLDDPVHAPDVNFISVLTIMKSAVQMMISTRSTDIELVNSFLNLGYSKIQESDTHQQSQLLIDTSKIKLHLDDPYFNLHPVIKQIKMNIESNLDQINEITVLHVLDAHVYLPEKFGTSLLEKIQKIVITTITKKPDQLTTDFLFKMILPFLKMKRHIINQTCLNGVFNLLCQRISDSEDFFNLEIKFINFCVEIIHLGIDLDPQYQIYFENSSRQKSKQIASLFILHYKFNQNIKSQLQQIKIEQLQLEQPSLFLLGLLYDKYDLPSEKLKLILFPLIAQHPVKLLQYTYIRLTSQQWISDVFTQISICLQFQMLKKIQRSDMLRQVPRTIFNESLLNLWKSWIIKNRLFLIKQQLYEKFFTCISKPYDYIDIPYHGLLLYEFIIKYFEADIPPSFFYLLVRNQQTTVQLLLRQDESILRILFSKLQNYNGGNDIVQLIYLLEDWKLDHLINDKDLIKQFHYGFSLNQKFSNKLIYYMIKYCCLPTNQLALVFNNLTNPNDTELKLLLLMIQMFQSIENTSSLQEMVLNQIQLVSNKYNGIDE